MFIQIEAWTRGRLPREALKRQTQRTFFLHRADAWRLGRDVQCARGSAANFLICLEVPLNGSVRPMVNEVMRAPLRPVTAADGVLWRERGSASMVVHHDPDALRHPIAADGFGACAGDLTYRARARTRGASQRVRA